MAWLSHQTCQRSQGVEVDSIVCQYCRVLRIRQGLSEPYHFCFLSPQACLTSLKWYEMYDKSVQDELTLLSSRHLTFVSLRQSHANTS